MTKKTKPTDRASSRLRWLLPMAALVAVSLAVACWWGFRSRDPDSMSSRKPVFGAPSTRDWLYLQVKDVETQTGIAHAQTYIFYYLRKHVGPGVLADRAWKKSIQTGSDGRARFEFGGIPVNPFITLVTATGYKYIGTSGSPIVYPWEEWKQNNSVGTTPETPLILWMRKRGEESFLLKQDSYLEYDSEERTQPIGVNLLNGRTYLLQLPLTEADNRKAKEAGVDIITQIEWEDDGMAFLTLSILEADGGLLLAEPGDVNAPEGPYQNPLRLELGDGTGNQETELDLFVAHGKPRLYSRVTIAHAVRPGGWQAWIDVQTNPYGKRVLEEFEFMIGSVKRRLRHEATEALAKGQLPREPVWEKIPREELTREDY